MRYKFIGNVYAETEDKNKKNYFDRSGRTQKGKGDPYTSIMFSVASTKNNRAFVEIFGMEQKNLKVFDKDNQELEVDWDDRNDEEILKMVSNKKIMNFAEEGRKEFIADYDAAEFIKDHIYELNKAKVCVTGQVKKNIYEGKSSDRFVISNIYKADDDTDTGLFITGEFFFTKESIDTADWSKSKKIIINGHTLEYINSEKDNKFKGKMYVPRTVIFDCSRLDFENERHVKAAKYRLNQIGLDLDGDKIVNNLKRKEVYAISVVLSYINGQEEIEFDESELTENQKMAIDLGLKTLDDFKPKGKIYGDRKVEYKLIDFDLRDDYKDGYVTLKDKIEDFEEQIYVPATNESADEIMNAPTEEKSEEKEETIADLFG